MKVNIVSANNLNNASVDVEVLNLMFKKLRENIEIQHVNWSHYKCPNASINVFLQCMNYQFVQHAKVNVAIIDHENMTMNMVDYLANMDYVICKSYYSYQVIQTALKSRGYPLNNLVELGWRSPNIEVGIQNKNFQRVLLFCNQRNSDIYSRIIDEWNKDLPVLEVVSANTNIILRNPKTRKEQSNINYNDKIESHEFHKLFNECGFHLIIEDRASFENLINQCQQVGSIPIALYGGANREIFSSDNGVELSCKKKKSIDTKLGSLFSFNPQHVISKITDTLKLSSESIGLLARDAKINSHNNTSKFEAKFLDLFKNIVSQVRVTKKPNYKLSDENLPTVSIITPTYNRKKFFSLAIFNYNSFDYPREKLEWIIIDDSTVENSVESLLPVEAARAKYNITYLRLDDKTTIGEKRNKAIKQAKNDIIVCMDDDDYYYPESIRTRIEQLVGFNSINKNIKCVGCGTFAAFEINKYISIINNKNYDLPFYHKISPASLAFYRDFTTQDTFVGFSDLDKNEANDLIKDRVNQVAEISWENIMVALIHRNNISDMRVPGDEKPNGCHFKFSEKLFKFITELDT
jgi:hypothetical protein